VSEIAPAQPRITLYGFPFSHPCVSARLMLEHKRLAYADRVVTPGLHPFVLIAAGFQGRTVPAARIDGELVQGSRAISAALDHHFPGRPLLFPTEAAHRGKVIVAERAGEDLQNAARRIAYLYAKREPQLIAGQLRPGHEDELPTKVAARAIAALGAAAHGATKKRSLADLEGLPERLACVSRWIADGVIGTNSANAADFQIGPSLRMLQMFEPVTAIIEDAGLGDYARALVPEYPPPPRIRPAAQPDFSSTSVGTLA
jgi:glutathione S-transferase